MYIMTLPMLKECQQKRRQNDIDIEAGQQDASAPIVEEKKAATPKTYRAMAALLKVWQVIIF